MKRYRPRTVEELERLANIERTEERKRTLNDIEYLERKMLGPLWGKKRRKMEGPPR